MRHWPRNVVLGLESTRCEPWHAHGGWTFAIAPEADVQGFPAFWCPEAAACVIVVTAIRRGHSEIPGIAGRRVVAEQRDGICRYVVLDGRRGRHRLKIVGTGNRNAGTEFRTRADPFVATRIAALSALVLGTVWPSRILPSSYRRHQLVRLLAVLDLVIETGQETSVLRRIAAGFCAGRAARARSIEWKSSSERRQAQRLLAEARRMEAVGYRRLLTGPPL
jgi:hypothetical protein